MTSPGKYDLIRKLHQIQQSSCVKHGTLQQLALSAIVSAYDIKREGWIHSMPCVPKPLRQEILKRLMYKGRLDNDLFSLCIDKDKLVWDLRSVRGEFTDDSSTLLSRIKCIEILRLSNPSCTSPAMSDMLQNFTNLRLLEIIYTPNMDDFVIEKVAAYCPTLQVLNVKATGITDTAMTHLADANISLLELDISYTNVSPNGIKHLKRSNMKDSLQLLRFGRCPLLGDCAVIRDIIVGFPNLMDYSFDFIGADEAEINSTLNELPEPVPGQNVSFRIPF